ncbi:unnamed protein product, partial [Amoebophrya sp. A120]|eukprot:GSA120T00011924001.1
MDQEETGDAHVPTEGGAAAQGEAMQLEGAVQEPDGTVKGENENEEQEQADLQMSTEKDEQQDFLPRSTSKKSSKKRRRSSTGSSSTANKMLKSSKQQKKSQYRLAVDLAHIDVMKVV